jgi:hypothetical protein
MTGFGGSWVGTKIAGGKIRREVKKKMISYSCFTFQNTAAAATHKTNTPTAAWKFKLGPVDGVAARW